MFTVPHLTSTVSLLWAVLLGPHQDLWLCDLLSDGWHKQPLKEVVEALAPNILVRFLSVFVMVQVFTIPFPPVCNLCSFSQIFASRWLQTWLELPSHWFDYLEELPGISFRVCCFQFHAHAFQLLLLIYSELSLYLSLQFLISVLIFAFCFHLFLDCCKSLNRYPFLFPLRLCASSHFSGYFLPLWHSHICAEKGR